MFKGVFRSKKGAVMEWAIVLGFVIFALLLMITTALFSMRVNIKLAHVQSTEKKTLNQISEYFLRTVEQGEPFETASFDTDELAFYQVCQSKGLSFEETFRKKTSADKYYRVLTVKDADSTPVMTMIVSAESGSDASVGTFHVVKRALNGRAYDSAKLAQELTTLGATKTYASADAFFAEYSVGINTDRLITFNLDGGCGNFPVITAVKGKCTLPTATPTKSGKLFGGWSDGTSTYLPGSEYTALADVTMTAQWVTACTLTVKSENTNGTVSTSSVANIPSGSVITVSGNTFTVNGTTVTASPKSGYAFKQWNGIPGDNRITANTTVTATWVNTYTVTVESDSTTKGKVDVSSITGVPKYSEVSVNGNKFTVNGTTATATPTDAAKYQFSSWSIADGAQITGKTTVTAKWANRVYNVKFRDCNNPSATYTYNTSSQAVTLSVPTKSGYVFDGWSATVNSGAVSSLANTKLTVKSGATGDIELTPIWKRALTVTYNYNDGSGQTTPTPVAKGYSVTLATPTRTGYTFNGWYTAASGGSKVGNGGASYTPTDNITLYAQWSINSHTVTLSLSNATGSISYNGTTKTSNSEKIEGVPYGAVVTVKCDSFSKDSNQTIAWNGNDLGTSTGTSYTFKMPDENVTVEISSSGSSCYATGTLITLADGTQKPVEQLTFNDPIMAWDFFEGKTAQKDISLLVFHGNGQYDVVSTVYSDGTVLRTIGEHGVFDYDANRYVYLTAENCKDYIGHRFVQYAADAPYRLVTMTDAFVTQELTGAYSVSSSVTSNAFANGLLTVAPPDDFYNWIDMAGKLRYDTEQFRKDVAEIGTYDYAVFSDYVTYDQYVAFNGAYLKVAVEKGKFTLDYVLLLIGMYAQYMPE